MRKRKTITIAQVEPGVLGIEEAAAFLGIGRTSIFALVRDGSLGHLKIGTRTLIPRSSLQAFLDRATKQPTPPEAA